MQGRPKILFLTSHWPMAPAYGAQQRVLNTAGLLRRFGDVSFVIVPTEVEDEGTALRTLREFEVLKVVRPLPVPNDKRHARLSDRFRHEFDVTYMATDFFEISAPDRSLVLGLIPRYDIVWVHTIRTANWFRIYHWPHSVLDVDDLISRQQSALAQVEDNPVERLLERRRAWIWHRRERLFIERFDVLTVCSEEDRKYLGNPERTYVLPNGSHPQAVRSRTSREVPRIGHIGNCAHAPNEEGLKWFIREAWPKLKREFAGAQLRLVGRGSDGYFKEMGPNIIGLGWLEDPGDEIASWSAMIVPIKTGSGTRVKLVDGLARGCPIVATTLGAFGYDLKDEQDILLADGADDFAAACARLLKDPELGRVMSEKARLRFLERWTWDSFENTVGTVVQECLARNRQTRDDSGVGPLATNVPRESRERR